ncbi:zinc transporter ZupT [Candidatus Acetothermia bacterium]|jgi:ZIP family zinc transporter|nr:zinc transporter ZupT [Candidatus Acetothermia bacterium]MCI2426344.1 zinc transporter ZupT [Candidatus Acetothermia bacterium]MCI2427120.1 zinc transporter ZupT [Candidatus Acetothermia bacterium]MCI2428977.1 zinc transporter ZupT [Candidatus Acetothermia bacterium]
MIDNFGLAFLITMLAGLSTAVGGLIGIIVRKPGPRFMALALGFSAGVMILLSYVQLLQGGIEQIGFVYAHLAFFVGMGVMFLVDISVPHNFLVEDHRIGTDERSRRMMKTGWFVALGITTHNFPEGMATFMATLVDPSLGLAIAVAIAFHNIPEGIAVAAPIYAATNRRKKAFLWSFFAGLSEPVGAGLAALVLMPFLTDTVLSYVLAVVGGAMVFISLDELIPATRIFKQDHIAISGVIAGMIVMAVSLWLLR